MSSYLSQKELVAAIEKNIHAMESGSLSLNEMEKHFEQVRELYERTLILRYKAFEKNSSVAIETTSEIEDPITNNIPNIEVVEAVQQEVETPLTTKTEVVIPSKMEELTPAIEFDLFATISEEEEQTTSNYSQEHIELDGDKREETPTTEMENSTEYSVLETPSTSAEDTDTEVSNQTDEEYDESNPFNIIDVEEEDEDTESTTESYINPLDAENEKLVQVSSNANPVYESSIMDAPTEQVATHAIDGPFYNKVFKIYNDAKNQYGYYSLPALSGSFGLNERLMYINELFDGSSEAFSDAIKHLDSRKDLVEAAQYVQELAQTNDWEIESDTVEEFIHKVGRRFA